ncbi:MULTISPECIES: hypothetical protein [unclassified Nocardioides]|jgi:hypothetical protein|uniref:hypothetical protein n=1 Tax=Nocardioides sp. URHA0032 TaxID=1380388 RepID=UPI0012DD464F|nr:hypothetical protein [Nocardioides sp. URHA0032]
MVKPAGHDIPPHGVPVATLPVHLEMRLLGLILDALESTLFEAGATRVWIDRNRPPLTVMAELPESNAGGHASDRVPRRASTSRVTSPL